MTLFKNYHSRIFNIIHHAMLAFRLTRKLESHMFMFHLCLSFKNIQLV
jgi:hypothetical protein